MMEIAMEITESLKAEHRVIEKYLVGLDNLGEALLRGEDVPISLIKETTLLIREFAHRYHQAKEESLLFPFIDKNLGENLRNSLQKLMDEHGEGRAHIRSLLRYVEKLEKDELEGDNRQATCKQLITTARSCSSSLRRHILREDRNLFPGVEKKLTENQKRWLWGKLEEFEDERHGQPDLDYFEQQARQLMIRVSDVVNRVRV